MTPAMPYSTRSSGLPDPELQPEFYNGVLPKRLLAWVVDVVLLFILTTVLATLTVVGWFFWAGIYLVLSFVYRTATLQGGGTLGMRFFGIELRNAQGARFSGAEAVLHTATYLMSMAFFLPMILSWGTMLTNDFRGHRVKRISEVSP